MVQETEKETRKFPIKEREKEKRKQRKAPNKEIMPTLTVFALLLTTTPIIIKIMILF